MYTMTETYEDFLGVERTGEYKFNLTEAEILKMEMGRDGGLTTFMQRITKTQNGPELIKLFEQLVQLSYGVISDDGRKFVKNQEVLDDFVQTPAYSQIFMKLATNADAAADFVKGILPSTLAKKLPENYAELAKAQAMGNA